MTRTVEQYTDPAHGLGLSAGPDTPDRFSWQDITLGFTQEATLYLLGEDLSSGRGCRLGTSCAESKGPPSTRERDGVGPLRAHLTAFTAGDPRPFWPPFVSDVFSGRLSIPPRLDAVWSRRARTGNSQSSAPAAAAAHLPALSANETKKGRRPQDGVARVRSRLPGRRPHPMF